MDELIAEFRKLVSELPSECAPDPTELLLQLLSPEKRCALRACAIPHTFTDEIITVMLPDLEREQALAYYTEFTSLSIVMPDQEGLSLHDRARKKLFAKWLNPECRGEFSGISRRLAEFFRQKENKGAEQAAELAARLSMFHLIGAEQEAGFARFESLCRRARDQFRLSECATLLRLVHEYDPVLTQRNALCLAYHEGKLASDLHRWEEAEPLFNMVLENSSAPPELKVKALGRLGHLDCQRRLWPQAVEHYMKALDLVQQTPEARSSIRRLTHDLGAAYRELGDLAKGEELLQKSIELARKEKDLIAMAISYNSLGILQLKQGNAGAAIESFNTSLEYLTEAGETFRTAQVYNNLGLVYDQRSEWPQSERYYLKSLEIKRRAGDSLGQAFALNNIARSQVNQGKLEDAVDSLTDAISLFGQMRDEDNLAVATRNRGRLYRRLKRMEPCLSDLQEALRLFRQIGKADEAASVQEEIDSQTRIRTLPWWAWVAIILFPLLLFILLALDEFVKK